MSTLQDLRKQTALYGQLFAEHQDEERVTKAAYLAQKIIDQEYTIGFAGHFSAGKSSMINALTGDDLLPSSPIPTSANIVKVQKADEDYAIIHRTDGSAVKFSGHHFPAAIKAFSKDGAAVALVQIGHTESKLPERITVMDTPGVDSIDDAHRLSTESALHLADLVFYTMDYNHVQSELNFKFTKELMRYNENVYLIINQIDKHRESELSFEQFKQSTENSFKLWGVEPKGIFYTSLKERDLAHNDFVQVKAIVDGSIKQREEHFIYNVKSALRKLYDEHVQFLQQEMDMLKDEHQEELKDDQWSQYEELKEEAASLKNRLAVLSEDEFYLTFEQERTNLLQNAAITPFETRELLKDYLESKSPRFKVGLLFGAKKTAAEKERRQQAFADNIQTLARTQIEVHLKSLMKNTLKTAGILTDERTLTIDEMDMLLPFAQLDEALKVTDVITGETVLNMSDQMKTTVHTIFRKMTDAWRDEMATVVAETGSEQTANLADQLRELEEKITVIESVRAIEQQKQAFVTSVETPSIGLQKKRDALLAAWEQKRDIETIDFDPTTIKEETTTLGETQSIPEAQSVVVDFADGELVSSNAKHVATKVQAIPGFLETATYLKTKANRLDDQQFTVALFGAFSAGKSSFSNALIGEKVLPVSPNPTTAAINRIRPVLEGKENQTADVHLKPVEQMTEDVRLSFEALSIPVTTLKDAFAKCDTAIQKELDDESLHIHKSFIKAFQKGYPVYVEQLGQTLNVDREQFTRFVAEEDRSCFVESIDFYIDCPLTRQGITLVDTPGADSINARHTDVAFDYIRNADAILFVTYYNHAFARADREFLIQLGRVKDAFEMDKMFFIVNAIDLAANDEEAESVKQFVANELVTFGIRQPRVYGVSSLEALEAKQVSSHYEPMQHFEEHFHQFLEHDLKGLAIQALEEETTKTIERLATLIERTVQNQTRKAERSVELLQLEQQLKAHFEKKFVDVLNKATTTEVRELVYYILQRVFLRFNDFLKEGYTPSTFANHSAERALSIALAETVQMVGFDFTQELKVTNLRVLNFMKKQLNERQRQEIRHLFSLDEAITPTPYESGDGEMLHFETPYPSEEPYRSVNKLFKNQKAFFERGDRDVLKNRLEELLKEDASTYLEREQKRLEQWATDWMTEEAEALRNYLLQESLQQVATERTLLEDTDQLDVWRSIYKDIQPKELAK